MKAKKVLLLFSVLFSGILINFTYAQAICPVCTVAVADGLGLSRWLGIDDFISAIWIGGLGLSVSAWGWNYLKKKDKLNGLSGSAVLILVYLSIVIPLYKFDFIGSPLNTLWGRNKILFGIAAGTIVFWLGAFVHTALKKKNEGTVYFKFQKVVVPVGFLLIASLAYYAYCKCYNIL